MANELFIGLMSGTSVDSIDAAAISNDKQSFTVVATHTHPIPQLLKEKILQLCQPGENEINRMGELDTELGALFAQATLTLLDSASIEAKNVIAIGSHGQTIRHAPDHKHPFTLQIGNPAVISEMTGITTIADFRRADMAAGGQGAPLVPAFHHAVFQEDNIKRVIVNIGGMANISILNDPKRVSGFDTGPGNVLLNEWIKKCKNLEYDKNGEWAEANTCNQQLLGNMLEDKYFLLKPPKSTGREHFNLSWLLDVCQSTKDSEGNIQSTLSELTAQSIASAIQEHAPKCEQLVVCGGGVHNLDLMNRLKKSADRDVINSAALGLDPDFVEASAFGWLAQQTLLKKPANVPSVTGAKHSAILGAIYPAYPR